MAITCTNSSPLNFGDSSQKTFKVCTFLVNVLSHMYTQWTNAGSPLPPLFNWKPENVCPVTSDFNVADYEFGELIWSTFTYKNRPCCTYAYAIYNPDKPCNLAYDACEKGDK